MNLKELRKSVSPDVAALNADVLQDAAYLRPARTVEAGMLRNAGDLGAATEALLEANGTPLEHDEQVKLFEWADDMQAQHPELAMLYANVNGGKLPYHYDAKGEVTSPQRIKLVKEGLKRGVPDITLAVARGRFHGLYIELKRADGKNKPSTEQCEWIERLRYYGYCAMVCYGCSEAQQAIMAYLGQEG